MCAGPNTQPRTSTWYICRGRYCNSPEICWSLCTVQHGARVQVLYHLLLLISWCLPAWSRHKIEYTHSHEWAYIALFNLRWKLICSHLALPNTRVGSSTRWARTATSIATAILTPHRDLLACWFCSHRCHWRRCDHVWSKCMSVSTADIARKVILFITANGVQTVCHLHTMCKIVFVILLDSDGAV